MQPITAAAHQRTSQNSGVHRGLKDYQKAQDINHGIPALSETICTTSNPSQEQPANSGRACAEHRN